LILFNRVQAYRSTTKKKGGEMRKIVIILILLTLSFGCKEFMKRLAVKELDFSLVRVSLIDYTLSDMTLKLDIMATNPNDIDAVIDRLDYSFFINEKNAANGSTLKRVTIKAGREKTVSTELTIDYLNLGAAILEAVKDKRADFRIEGKVYIDTEIGSISFPITLFYP